MDTRFRRTFLTVAVLLGAVALAQAAWLGPANSSGTSPVIEVTGAGAGRTQIEINLSGVMTETVTIDGKDHAKLVLPGHVQLLERGAPQVPYITTSLIIPDQGTSRLRVVRTEYREYATDPIVPSKGPILRTVDPKTVSYVFGPAYQGGVFPAEVAELSEPYIVRDYRGLNVRLYPVQWDADRGVVRVLVSATVEVVTEGSGGINSKTTGFGRITPVFDSLYAQKFDNYDGAAKYELNADEGPMLIVCYDAFEGAMQPFIQWKQERGLDVELITTSSVGGTTTGIQAAIQERYDSAEGLAFVILVGDGPQVPHYSGAYEGADDDTRYMRLDGSDVYPDALISRISAADANAVSTQVAKFVTYERDIDAAADWPHLGTGIASNEGSPSDATRMDWLRDDMLAYNYTDVDQIYQGQGGSTAGIAAAVNEGRSLLNYMGHGSGTSWSSVPFNNSNVHALTNTAWPWIIDVACLNGGISAIGESFAEAWMRAGSPGQPYGAVGMYAASTSCPWVPPTLMQSEAVELMCAETANIIGVLCHAGIMAVLDEYGTSGTGLQLIEQYNLFGDCSLVVRTDTPNAMDVVHQPVVPMFTPSFAVDTGVGGVSVALSGNGVIYGTGTTDAGGHVDLLMTNDVDTIGEVTLTVFGYNQETYQVILQVVVPANVVIEPAGIPVGETTTVTVTVTDPDTDLGMDNILVSVEGFGYDADPVQTDVAGQASFEVTPEYGEILTIRGQEIGEPYFMFGEGLPVSGALALGDPAVAASVPSIGMIGTLTPHIEGEITASIRNEGFTLYLGGGGLDVTEETSGTGLTVLVTPTELSDVVATIARPGFQIYQETVSVVAAFGTLAGTVTDVDYAVPLAGARIVGFPMGSDPDGTPLFDLLTGSDGTYVYSEDLAVGYYDLYITNFGYLPYQETYFLLYGANVHAIGIAQAPAGTLTGLVAAEEDGAPLEATIQVYRTDNDELYNEVSSDPGSGQYTTGNLPYFEYRIVVRATRRIPQTVNVIVDAASVQQDFALVATEGDILLLDDNSGAAVSVPAKYDPDTGELLAPGYNTAGTRAASDIAGDLEDLGYTVTLETAAVSNPAEWPLYDLVICSSGDNTTTLSSSSLRSALTTFYNGGGRLLMEGGEVAYDMQATDPTFLQHVLHVDDWSGDNSGDFSVADAAHRVMSVPNVISGPIDNAYSGYGDADRVTPTSSGHMAGNWTQYLSLASVITADDDEDPLGGQFVFFLFNYSAMGPECAELLHNAVNWLLTSELDPTPVAEEERLPTAVTLEGNYPNPFNPMTVIEFALPSAQDVQLAVYDVRGQRVRLLVSEALEAGRHSVTWLGRDDTGRQVASGMYFYRLTAGSESRVAKMLLLK